jgi:hypothetical protein
MEQPVTTVVGVLGLQVIIAPDGNQWVAQAIQIDYAAGGDSEEDAKLRFEMGLEATIHEHLKMFGHLDNLLVPAPAELWRPLFKKKSLQRYNQVSVHHYSPLTESCDQFPFGGLEFFKASEEGVAA